MKWGINMFKDNNWYTAKIEEAIGAATMLISGMAFMLLMIIIA